MTSDADPENSATPDAQQQPSRQRGILVVDDDESMRTLLDTWLRSQGYNVWLASTGHETIDLYQRHQSSISVLLMDVNMAIMDGPQTLVALRRLNPHIICCFMSASLTGYTEADLIALGAKVIVHKPFRLTDLSQILQTMIAALPAPSIDQIDSRLNHKPKSA